MDVVILARLQFAIVTVYHFFFVPLTLGLSILVAIMETMYVRTGDETYKKMTKFWGKLFLINFAMGVVTGIVQEFQFGMNWSEYSRFMGDIFGAPLAIEALLAFYLESVFIGVWIFGWDKISKRAARGGDLAGGHRLQHLRPVDPGRQLIHAAAGGLCAAKRPRRDGRLLRPAGQRPCLGPVAARLLLRRGHRGVLCRRDLGLAPAAEVRQLEVFRRSFRIGVLFATIGIVLSMLVGHSQAQYMIRIQPMKMAAAEALWETEDPAAMSLFTIGNEKERRRCLRHPRARTVELPRLQPILRRGQGHQRPPGGVHADLRPW